jgi:Zn-dependent protease
LPVFVVWTASAEGEEIGMALALLVLVATSIVLHELGHALVARRLGLRAPKVTLYPTGGIAWFDDTPPPPAEWRIAIAGPAVNLALAAALAFALAATAGPAALMPVSKAAPEGTALPAALLWVNLSIAVFNLMPAYPMDGGRLLRAMLALRFDAGRATTVAALVGQILALALASAGLATRNGWLGILAAVVFIGAIQQARAERPSPSSRARWAMEAMVTRIVTLAPEDLLTEAARQATATAQQEFPVVDGGGRLCGILARHAIFHGLQDRGPRGRVGDAMDRNARTVGPRDDLREVLNAAEAETRRPILVVDEDRVVGMIPALRLGEYAALDARHSPGNSGETVSDGIVAETADP